MVAPACFDYRGVGGQLLDIMSDKVVKILFAVEVDDREIAACPDTPVITR